MQMWQIGLATAVGTLILANPVQAANGTPLLSQDGASLALLVIALVVGVALMRRRREARVTC